jgi:DNA-binding Lrp family transcriptional regulator
MRALLDKIDRKLVKLLSDDAREGANQIAERLDPRPSAPA